MTFLRNLVLKFGRVVLAMAVLAPVGAGADEPFDRTLTVFREFLTSKRSSIMNNGFAAREGHERASLEWLAKLQANAQMTVDNREVWLCYMPLLWDNVRSLDGESIKKMPINDQEELFAAVCDLYLHPESRLAGFFAGNIIFRDFDQRLVDKHADELMRPYLVGKEFSVETMNMMLFRATPKAIVTRYQDRLEKQFAINRAKVAEAKKANKDYDRVFLLFNAVYGEPAAQNEIISSFLSCSAELREGMALSVILDDMFAIGTREALVAVLSRFPEETGAPEFDVSGVKPRSPRYQMLVGFKRLYPDDPFFVKYRDHLHDNGSVAMDDEIGGEEGVKKMFEEFRDWAKAKFGYEMDLSKVTYHMNNSYLDDTIE